MSNRHSLALGRNDAERRSRARRIIYAPEPVPSPLAPDPVTGFRAECKICEEAPQLFTDRTEWEDHFKGDRGAFPTRVARKLDTSRPRMTPLSAIEKRWLGADTRLGSVWAEGPKKGTVWVIPTAPEHAERLELVASERKTGCYLVPVAELD